MPFFPVYDEFPFHPKTLIAGNAAVGLWARCGAWCKQHTTGGFVPDPVARSMGSAAEAKALVVAGLWDKAEGGYQFHDWTDAAGNGTADEERGRKQKNAERQKRWRDKRRASGDDSDGERNALRDGGDNASADAGLTEPPVPVPVPTDGLDVTYEPEISPEGDVVAIGTEPISELNQVRAKRAGIRNLRRVRMHLGKVVAPLGQLSDQATVELVTAITDRAKGEVRAVDAYVIAVAEKNPEDICRDYDNLDLAAVGTHTPGGA